MRIFLRLRKSMNFQCKSSFKWTLMVVVFTRNNANFGTRNANRVFPRGQNMGSPFVPSNGGTSIIKCPVINDSTHYLILITFNCLANSKYCAFQSLREPRRPCLSTQSERRCGPAQTDGHFCHHNRTLNLNARNC